MPNFAQEIRYNERALVYSGLLSRNTAFSGGYAPSARNRACGAQQVRV